MWLFQMKCSSMCILRNSINYSLPVSLLMSWAISLFIYSQTMIFCDHIISVFWDIRPIMPMMLVRVCIGIEEFDEMVFVLFWFTATLVVSILIRISRVTNATPADRKYTALYFRHQLTWMKRSMSDTNKLNNNISINS